MNKINIEKLCDTLINQKSSNIYRTVHLEKNEVSQSIKDEIIRLLSLGELILNTLKSRKKMKDFFPVLVIPLDYSSELTFWKDIELLEVNFCIEPPIFYLIKNSIENYIDNYEEYKIKINTEPFLNSGVSCIYRCFRSDLAVQNSWEYSRAIYIDIPFIRPKQ